MEFKVNISQVYNAAFGVAASRFIRFNTAVKQDEDPGIIYHIQDISINDAERLSDLGTPIAFPIIFKAGNYQIYKDGEIVSPHLKKFELPWTSMVDFSRAKVINKTKVSGRAGTVKESYSFDDWSIRIRGIFLGDGVYPESEVSRLLEFENIVDSIQILEGELFRMKGIHALSIESVSLPQTPRFPHVQAFEISCSSDEPLELII